MVKEELNQEEKLFESAVKTERFVKKYKMPLISIVVTVIVVLIGNSVYQASKAQSIAASNEAYMTLLAQPDNSEADKVLQENNPALYDAWKFQRAVQTDDKAGLESLTSSKSNVIADLASYELAAANKDKSALNAYALNQKAVLKDLAILDEAVLLMQEGKSAEAKARLALIDDRSPLKKLSMLLQHYGVE